MLAPVQNSGSPRTLANETPTVTPDESLPEAEDLYSYARYEMQRGNLGTAASILEHLSAGSRMTPGLRERVQTQIRALGGNGGLTGARLEFLSNQFFSQVFDPIALGSMVGAGLTYKLARLGFLGAAGRLGLSGAWLRPCVSLLAFGLEATTFPLYGNLGHLAMGREVVWQNFSRQVASSFLVLGGLKFFGYLGAQGDAWVRNFGEAGRISVFQQPAMYLGILSGHGAEQALGLAPRQNWDQLLGESFGTLLHFNAAGRLIPLLTGPRIQAWERGLESVWQEDGLRRQRESRRFLPRSVSEPNDEGFLSARNFPVNVTSLILGFATFFKEQLVMAQENISDPGSLRGTDSSMDWILGIGVLAFLGSLAVRSYLRYRHRQQVDLADSNPEVLRTIASQAPRQLEAIRILEDLGQRNPDAVRALHEAAQRSMARFPLDAHGQYLLHLLHHFDVEFLAPAAHHNHRAVEALRILAGEPYHNPLAFQALQHIPLPTLEAYVPLAQRDVGVAYLFWELSHKQGLPGAWGVLLGFDWENIISQARQDWRAAEMIGSRALQNKNISLSELQSFPVRELWEATPNGRRAHLLNKVIERWTTFGNPHALELLQYLTPERLAGELPMGSDFFEALGILGEYGIRRTPDILAKFAETDIRALAHLVRLSYYGDLIATNLLRSLNVRQFEADAREHLSSLSALLILHREGNPSAKNAMERLTRGHSLLINNEFDWDEVFERDTNVHSPKGYLSRDCQYFLDEFSSLPGSEQIGWVNRIWQTWHDLSPPERLPYYARAREEGMVSEIPIGFLQEVFQPEKNNP